MSVKDRETLAALLAAQPADPPDQSVSGMRAGIEALMAQLPPTPGFEIRMAELGGIRGEWVRGQHVTRSDAALLYLHGGGYVAGSPKSHRHLVGQIAIASGLPVFSADYRLGPEHPFPAAVHDGVAAYRALLAGGIAPSQLAIAGDSAGGGLALATLVAARDGGLPMPACAVSISPWADLSRGGESHRARVRREPVATSDVPDVLASWYLGGADPKAPYASPLFADLQGLPPLLIQAGTEEALYDDAVALAKRAQAAGVEVSFESWGGMLHVWHIFHPILSEGRDAIARIASFLRGRIE